MWTPDPSKIITLEQKAVAAKEALLSLFRTEIQSCLDVKAQERGYDNGHTIATYVGSTVEPWATEAQAFVTWRDDVWVYAFAEMEKVENGEREAPTPQEFCTELPAFEWPAS